jgi:hypothetical protein
MEFFDWSILQTMAGAMFAVAILTELTKDIPGIRKIPTQIWSFVLALGVLVAAQAFTDGLTVNSAALSLVNAAMVSLAANGGYELLDRLKAGQKQEAE